MKRHDDVLVAALIAALVTGFACSDSTGMEPGGDSGANNGDVPAIFTKFSSSVQVSVDGDYIMLRANSVPNHGSPYFATGDSRYQAYNGTNPQFARNPNSIVTQSLTVRIPVNPQKATTTQATGLGAIGLALNGVAIFNQYAGPDRPLTNEINSFDQYNGHPQQTGMYHYHVEPLYLTAADATGLIGFLLDGYPVYGPMESGRRITNADLDELHGHFTVTPDYPNGIYHYHITAEDPYINGAGYYGRPGTVSQ